MLGISRSTVISELLRYQIPCPALVRTLTPSEHARIAEIRKAYRDEPEQLGAAVVSFISDVWSIARNTGAENENKWPDRESKGVQTSPDAAR